MPDDSGDRLRGRVPYGIFGCGTYGYQILQELAPEHHHILIIDWNEERARRLHGQDHDVVVGDISKAGFISSLSLPEIVFVCTSSPDINIAAVRNLKSTAPAISVAVRATDPVAASDLMKAGADVVVFPEQVAAKTAVHWINKIHEKSRSGRLFSLLSAWDGTLGIVTHNNPDPDAISSAMALAAIARTANPDRLQCRILYDGIVGYPENRMLVKLLGIRLEKVTPRILQECRYLALVDSPSPGVNNSLSPDTKVDIIIDHHCNTGKHETEPEFKDVRPGIGATASIITGYLQELRIAVDGPVATGLLHGIRTDTGDFKRNVTPMDHQCAAFLLPQADNAMLDRIMFHGISGETLDVLGTAIRNRMIREGYLFANAGFISNRDTLPQAADMLINLEGVNTALVYGMTDSEIVISVRNRNSRLHIGDIFAEAFGDIGEAGGHASMAAATIPLAYAGEVCDREKVPASAVRSVITRFATLVDVDIGDEK